MNELTNVGSDSLSDQDREAMGQSLRDWIDSRPEPDPRVAEYVREVTEPGVPIYSTSHLTLSALYQVHGQAVVEALLRDHWFKLRVWNLRNQLRQRKN